MTPLYTASAFATAGREGRVQTTDSAAFELGLSMPKGLGGAGGDGTNPEQLFAAGYSACFSSALSLVARMQKQSLAPFQIAADVSIGKVGEAYGLSVVLTGTFTGIPQDAADALMAAAHQVCPYSNATRGNIEVQLVAKVA